MSLVHPETERNLNQIGFNHPRYSSGTGNHVIGWDFVSGQKHGFIINIDAIYYFTGTQYSFFNSCQVSNGKSYILAEYTRDDSSQVQMHCKKGDQIVNYDMPQVTQCSLVVCVKNGEVQWSRYLYLNHGDVRAYGMRIREHIVEISGSLGYIQDDQLNTVQIRINQPSGSYGFIASFSDVGWLHIICERNANITDLHYAGYVVKAIRHFDDECLSNEQCTRKCGCYYHIYVDNKCIHDSPIETDVCGDYVLLCTDRKTWIYDVVTETKYLLPVPIKAHRLIGDKVLLYSAVDRKWFLYSREHHPITIEPEYDWFFFTVTIKQLEPINTKTESSSRVIHIHVK